MDPRWLPWCWGAGAIACGVLFFAVQPWRAEWRMGWNLMRQYPAAWLAAWGLAAVDALEAWAHGQSTGGIAGTTNGMVVSAVRQSLQGWTFGAGAGLLGIGLLLFNAGGMRRGMIKGVESVTGKRGRVWLGVLWVGALALAADVLLQGREIPAVWSMVVTFLAVPLTGWVSAAVLGGWLLLAETAGRKPGKVAGVRWMESAAAHAARLWPWIILHGLGWWLCRWLPGPGVHYLGWALVVGAVGLGFAPLVFLHVKQLPEAGLGLGRALQLWRVAGWQLLTWLMGAAILFYGWGSLVVLLSALAVGAPDGVKLLLAGAAGMGQICLTFLSLGAWVAFRTAEAPGPPRGKRSSKAKSP